jgi:hypothetical protein
MMYVPMASTSGMERPTTMMFVSSSFPVSNPLPSRPDHV